MCPEHRSDCSHCFSGKTTLLRDVTGLLAERFGRRVVVVDTSNEIGGDGKVPHKCIGRARRMPVPHKSRQHEVLQEAVQNHNPEVWQLGLRTVVHEQCQAKLVQEKWQ